MSHHQERFVNLTPQVPTFENDKITLPVAGQGTIIFSPNQKSTLLEFAAPDDSQSEYKYFSLNISKFRYEFTASKKKWAEEKDILFTSDKGYDKYPKGPFWFSIDFENRLLKGGYGEPRAELTLFSFRFEECGDTAHKEKGHWYKVELKEGNLGPNLWPSHADDPQKSPYLWLKEMNEIKMTPSAKLITVFQDPITVNAAMAVKDMNHITMGDVSNFNATVPSNLPSVCRKLFENVGGNHFTLANVNKDFNLAANFDLAKAIQYSIDTEGKICNKIIADKIHEFNNPEMVYLRITMGGNQGESPGIPYVMEIWPSGKRSPIHNHGGSEAIIKVLHGEIECKLFATLSQATPTSDMLTLEKAYEPDHFKTCKFTKDQVTYITPWLNQIHQLKNTNPTTACITIQCYGYPEKNKAHYEYFNWLSTQDHELGDFFPDSDYNFNEFVIDIYNEYMEAHN